MSVRCITNKEAWQLDGQSTYTSEDSFETQDPLRILIKIEERADRAFDRMRHEHAIAANMPRSYFILTYVRRELARMTRRKKDICPKKRVA